tara:strand:- start:345 stop:1454 length:1110 start_codon:yes stop_codon:yes gene_type:complete
MGKSKGRVPIKGGSKKVRQIKNVQEGGRNIGSDKKMDVDMTNLLHFFKYIVDTDKNKGELNGAAVGEGVVGGGSADDGVVVNELKTNLAKLFYFLGGGISIILLRQNGRLKIDEDSPDKSYDEEKAKGYKNAMEKLGFDMEEVSETTEGVLKIARFKGDLPAVPDAVKGGGRITFPKMNFANVDGEQPWPEDMKLDLDNSEFKIDDKNNISISKNLHKVLGIPGDFKGKDGKITVHIDIFNEYRLPILHHILNLRIYLQKISGEEDNLNDFFFNIEDDKKNAILFSVASGRFLNATGYHIKPEKKLTRFEIESKDAQTEDLVNGLVNTKMLNLFQASGNTEKDKATDARVAAAGKEASKRLEAQAGEGE